MTGTARVQETWRGSFEPQTVLLRYEGLRGGELTVALARHLLCLRTRTRRPADAKAMAGRLSSSSIPSYTERWSTAPFPNDGRISTGDGRLN